jgi:hypothetical protein
MRLPSRTEFAQLRRLLPVTAAALLVAALALPMWVIDVHAVQYPGEVLQLKLYAFPHISGDYWEMAELNQYIGFYYPDPVYWQPNYEVHPKAVDVPEWSVGPLAFLVVAATGLFVALAPTERKLRLGLTAQFAGAAAVFTVLVADIQYRLYQTGHELDPDAPVMGIEPFTPPLWGRYEVANITSYSRFGAGAYLAMLAIGLLALAFYYRDSTATPRDLPDHVRGRLRWLRERVGRGDDSADENGPTDDPTAPTHTDSDTPPHPPHTRHP